MMTVRLGRSTIRRFARKLLANLSPARVEKRLMLGRKRDLWDMIPALGIADGVDDYEMLRAQAAAKRQRQASRG
jgi:hypothetical protein